MMILLETKWKKPRELNLDVCTENIFFKQSLTCILRLNTFITILPWLFRFKEIFPIIIVIVTISICCRNGTHRTCYGFHTFCVEDVDDCDNGKSCIFCIHKNSFCFVLCSYNATVVICLDVSLCNWNLNVS